MLPIKKAIATVVFVASMITGWMAPEMVLPANAPSDVPPIVIAEPGEPPAPEPTEPSKPPVIPGRICYLTFDDGPDGRITPAMLDVLKQYGVKATFFVVGSKVDAYPKILKRIKDEGHAIGNHTYSHNYAHKQDAAAFAADLEKANRAIERVTGERAMIMRVPGGSDSSFRRNVLPQIAKLGYQYYDWNVDSRDALDRVQTSSQMAERVVRQVAQYKVANVLMHSINTPKSLAALPAIIEGIQNLGYEFRVIDGSTTPLHFAGN